MNQDGGGSRGVGKFVPVDEALKLANHDYYRSKGTKIYADFDTVARCCPLVARADALDFVKKMKAQGAASSMDVYDFGIGECSFAFDFLDEVQKLDAEAYGRTKYTLCDISKKLLDEALAAERAKKHAGKLKAVEADAAAGTLKYSADYVRSNEMYDDLPAKVLVCEEDEIYEVLLAVRGHDHEMRKKRVLYGGELPESMAAMLEKAEGCELMFNFGALAHFREALRSLKKGGWMDIYDYGYADLAQAEEMPPEIWNEGIVREYGGQLTVDVNFALLKEEAEAQGWKAEVESVSARLERTFKRKFSFVDLREGAEGNGRRKDGEGKDGAGKGGAKKAKTWVGYMDAQELEKNAAMLGEAGYSEEFIDGEIEEEDSYLHLRVER